MYVPGCREWRVFRQADFAGKQVLYPVNPCQASCRRTGETFMVCACKMLSYVRACVREKVPPSYHGDFFVGMPGTDQIIFSALKTYRNLSAYS